jgi:hypothetical protein
VVFSWGHNSFGQLGLGGLGDEGNRPSPTEVAGLGTDNAYIATQGTRSMALKSDGRLFNWGSNDLNHLGDGTTTPHHSLVELVVVGSDNAHVVGGTRRAGAERRVRRRVQRGSRPRVVTWSRPFAVITAPPACCPALRAHPPAPLPWRVLMWQSDAYGARGVFSSVIITCRVHDVAQDGHGEQGANQTSGDGKKVDVRPALFCVGSPSLNAPPWAWRRPRRRCRKRCRRSRR